MVKRRPTPFGLRFESDSSYFRRLASEERTAALHAQHPKAREEHLAKADRYEDHVRAISAHDLHLKVRLTERM